MSDEPWATAGAVTRVHPVKGRGGGHSSWRAAAGQRQGLTPTLPHPAWQSYACPPIHVHWTLSRPCVSALALRWQARKAGGQGGVEPALLTLCKEGGKASLEIPRRACGMRRPPMEACSRGAPPHSLGDERVRCKGLLRKRAHAGRRPTHLEMSVCDAKASYRNVLTRGAAPLTWR